MLLRRLVIVSFDEISDTLLNEVASMLEGAPHRIVGILSMEPCDPISISQPEEDWSDSVEGASPGTDGLTGHSAIKEHPSAHTNVIPGSMISPILLKEKEMRAVEAMLEGIYEGDLVICLIDSDSGDKVIPLSFFSSTCISRGAFCLCMVSKRGTFRSISSLEEMNRMILDLNRYFHGVVCLSPAVHRERRFLELAHLLRHLSDLVFRPGIVNLDLADLMITSKGGTALTMTWGVAQPGGSASRSSIKNALSNALCDVDLSSVRKAMIHVISNRDLTLFDSLEGTEYLRSRIKDNARMIWGVTLTDEMDEDMEILLILATTPIELLLHWYGRSR